MKKSQRLNEMMRYLNCIKVFQVDDLVHKFQVSRRTILRDLTDLYEMGMPLESRTGPNGGYRVVKENILPPISFTINETMAITFAISSLKYFVSLPFDSEYKAVYQKFYLNLSETTRNKIDDMMEHIEFQMQSQFEESPFLSQIFQAILSHQIVSIIYLDVSREVQPIGLYASYGEWYLAAFCFKRNAFRIFRCDRITSLEKGSMYQPRDFKSLSLNEAIKLAKPTTQYSLKVHLTKTGAQSYRRTVWKNTHLKIHENGTGIISGEISEYELDFFSRFFLSMGREAKIVEPACLIRLIREKIGSLVQQYEM